MNTRKESTSKRTITQQPIINSPQKTPHFPNFNPQQSLIQLLPSISKKITQHRYNQQLSLEQSRHQKQNSLDKMHFKDKTPYANSFRTMVFNKQTLINGQFNQEPYAQNIQKISHLLPKHKKDRTILNLQALLKQVYAINPFFRKMGDLISSILFRIGTIITLYPKQDLHFSCQKVRYLSIIICGKIHLCDSVNKYKRYSINGETMGQQCLIGQTGKAYHSESARAVIQSCLLRIKVSRFLALRNQLLKNGNKHLFKQMEQSILNNYSRKRRQKNRFIKDFPSFKPVYLHHYI